MDAANQDNDSEALAPKPSKLVPMLLIVNSLLLVGVLAFQMMGGGGGHAAAGGEHGAAAEGEEGAAEGGHGAAAEGEGEGEGEGAAHSKKKGGGHGPMVALEDFTVHLRNPEANRYAKVTFSIEVRSEGDQTVIESQMPAIRDAFISYLSDRTSEELQGADALVRLKKALIDLLDELGDAGRVVRAIYITDLVVQ